ncbi:MAG: molybdopterin-dependent oxidoreductase [Chloroflexi bacterium]|nr:molybdopterin-dependent oxidoreductase [Chloroflexota bacterium]MYE38655.1 molybdopterin-dependent oxidoreductase [Chloroflexota bacterium]
MTLNVAGTSVVRRDLEVKLTGEARYTADLKLPGMLHGAILRSPHPHADILSVDAEEALRLPGVRAVITPFDSSSPSPSGGRAPIIPSPSGGGSGWGRLAPDMSILDTRVRFVGDEVAAVAADNPDTARAALELIRVEYAVLPHYMTPESALSPDAVAIHPGGNLALGEVMSLERGSVAEGFADADVVLEDDFEIPTHSAAPLEPRAALASWGEDEDTDLTVWKTTRGVHVDRDALAGALGLSSHRVRVIGPFLGAGYGNKDETRLAGIAAALSQRAGRPVRLEYSREDEFIAGRVRHAAKIHIRAGFKSDGSITAIEASALLDTGAYLASGAGVTRRAGQGILYLYHCANVKYEAHLAYTNRPTAGSYRALGAPQGHFALESLMDRAAGYFGMDPLDFRLKNHVRPEGQPGQRTSPPDQVIDSQPLEGGIPFSSNGLQQCLQLGSEAFGWREYNSESGFTGLKDDSELSEPNHVQSFNQINHSSDNPALKRGRGMAIMIYRGGPGSPSSAEVRVEKSGAIKLITGLMDVGEGATTVLPQIAAEILGAEYEQVEAIFADSRGTPDAPITAGSTATFSTGTAVVQAANEVRESLMEIASAGLEAPIYDLDAAWGWVYVKSDPSRRMALAEVASRMDGDELSATASIIPGSPNHIVNSFGAHFVEVEVDTDTGRVRVLRYVAAHDSGRIINPRAALNQAEGAVSQMLGFALSEELVTDAATGVTLNPGYLEHKSPTIQDYPDIQIIFADIVDPVGPLGAKGLGEVPTVGPAPAIANAIYNATGVRLRRTPFTPDRVLAALGKSQ